VPLLSLTTHKVVSSQQALPLESPPLPHLSTPPLQLGPSSQALWPCHPLFSGPLWAHLGCRAALLCKSLATPPPIKSYPISNLWSPSPLLLQKLPHKPSTLCAGSLVLWSTHMLLDGPRYQNRMSLCIQWPWPLPPLSSTPPHIPFPLLYFHQSAFSTTLFSPLLLPPSLASWQELVTPLHISVLSQTLDPFPLPAGGLPCRSSSIGCSRESSLQGVLRVTPR